MPTPISLTPASALFLAPADAVALARAADAVQAAQSQYQAVLGDITARYALQDADRITPEWGIVRAENSGD